MILCARNTSRSSEEKIIFKHGMAWCAKVCGLLFFIVPTFITQTEVNVQENYEKALILLLSKFDSFTHAYACNPARFIHHFVVGFFS